MSRQVHIVELTGCASRPLALYLKALGILRLVANQADPDAMGFWRESGFVLVSQLDADALLRFFLEDYRPTPLVDPWNGGSGFYPKDNHSGIAPVRAATASRFKAYREAIELGDRLIAGRDSAPEKEDKFELIRTYASECSDVASEWVDAAIVISGEGEPTYPALFGTGGNDGRLDFTNNFMQRMAALFDLANPEGAATSYGRASLPAALFGASSPAVREKTSIGQFFPSSAGGANAGTGPTGDAAANPWDFVLMLEGGIVLRASAVRRLASDNLARASAPFALHTSAAGFASATNDEEKNRGEQWLPIWSRPSSFPEIKRLFTEGRSVVGRKPVRRPVDFARAIARQGVARGIEAFERFGYLERNGQSNLAAGLGRWQVEARPRQNLLDPVADWFGRLEKAARDRNAPGSFQRLRRLVEERILDCTKRPEDPQSWIALLIEAGKAERQCVVSPRFAGNQGLFPLRRLPQDFLDAVDDGTPEVRLAIALASLVDTSRHDDVAKSLREYWLPMKGDRQFDSGANGLVIPPRLVGRGEDLTTDLMRVLVRRAMELKRTKHRSSLALHARGERYARLDDVEAYIDGVLDEDRILQLALPLMAVESFGSSKATRAPYRTPDPAHALFRLVTPCVSDDENSEIILEPRVLRALERGDDRSASSVALARLRSLGLRPKISNIVVSPARLLRIGAALLFPLSKTELSRCRSVLLKPAPKNESNNPTSDA